MDADIVHEHLAGGSKQIPIRITRLARDFNLFSKVHHEAFHLLVASHHALGST